MANSEKIVIGPLSHCPLCNLDFTTPVPFEHQGYMGVTEIVTRGTFVAAYAGPEVGHSCPSCGYVWPVSEQMVGDIADYLNPDLTDGEIETTAWNEDAFARYNARGSQDEALNYVEWGRKYPYLVNLYVEYRNG